MWAEKLHQEQLKAKAGKAKGRGKGKSGAKSTHWRPRTYAEMTRGEQWYLDNLWNGNLRAWHRDLCSGPVQAKPFIVRDR